jgi:hypothetical protein
MGACGAVRAAKRVANLSRSASAEAKARGLDDGALTAGEYNLTLATWLRCAY